MCVAEEEKKSDQTDVIHSTNDNYPDLNMKDGNEYQMNENDTDYEAYDPLFALRTVRGDHLIIEKR